MGLITTIEGLGAAFVEAHESVTAVLAAILCAQQDCFELLVAGLARAVLCARVSARIGDAASRPESLYGSEWNVYWGRRSTASRVYTHPKTPCRRRGCCRRRHL